LRSKTIRSFEKFFPLAGLYIHIPFCAKACHYCDFHFSTNQQKREEMISAINKELLLQRNYLGNESVQTIYFGGGTPSLLSIEQVISTMDTIRSIHDLNSLSEVTLEANPEDLTSEKLVELRSAGITRLSIGLQSFQDSILQFLNRCHTVKTGIQAFYRAREAGFNNISIDLIYAIPDLTLADWEENIRQAIELRPEHISAYTLTIEPKTVFGHRLAKGKLRTVSDDAAAHQMELLASLLETVGYEHYEISNFGKPGKHGLHNSNYWNQLKYLGVGPSAHSYNQISRQFNVNNNHLYLRAMEEGTIPFEYEQLSRSNMINEHILTSLRTSKGCDLKKLKTSYGLDLLMARKTYLENLTEKGLASLENETLTLTRNGRLLADKIASDLFVIDTD
jgi:oxygen-independent coproporphyrinogen-3 oxidase